VQLKVNLFAQDLKQERVAEGSLIIPSEQVSNS